MDAVDGIKDVRHLILRQQFRQVLRAAEQRILLPGCQSVCRDVLRLHQSPQVFNAEMAISKNLVQQPGPSVSPECTGTTVLLPSSWRRK
jgi:hypothetical protein